MVAVMMGNFEELVIPRPTAYTINESVRWFVGVKDIGDGFLTNDGLGYIRVGGYTDDEVFESIYFDSELHAYIGIETYYDYHSKPFPYKIEIEILEKVNAVGTINESRVMEFI